MYTDYQVETYQEVAAMACRWFIRNQNSNETPWGDITHSADAGRYLYEYFPADGKGRGAVVWTQGLAIMALHAADIAEGDKPFKSEDRKSSALLAATYLKRLQYYHCSHVENNGGFEENVPGGGHSYPRDAATGAMGYLALANMTGDQEYIDRATAFANWYKHHGCDENGWPYIDFRFDQRRGSNQFGDNEAVKGDWQAGGALFYYYLSAVTGERKYIDEYMLPMIDLLVKIYEDNPFEGLSQKGSHGLVPISFGNDDFALVALLAAYVATGDKSYYTVAKERILTLLELQDKQTGYFPGNGGTFVSGIAMLVLNQLDEAEGREPAPELVEAVAKVALNGVNLQAHDYNNPRIHGGFWGQTPYSISRDWVHSRSTGYATIFYSMLTSKTTVPYYHCLGWNIPNGIFTK
jgi:hypothetical protein